MKHYREVSPLVRLGYVGPGSHWEDGREERARLAHDLGYRVVDEKVVRHEVRVLPFGPALRGADEAMVLEYLPGRGEPGPCVLFPGSMDGDWVGPTGNLWFAAREFAYLPDGVRVPYGFGAGLDALLPWLLETIAGVPGRVRVAGHSRGGSLGKLLYLALRKRRLALKWARFVAPARVVHRDTVPAGLESWQPGDDEAEDLPLLSFRIVGGGALNGLIGGDPVQKVPPGWMGFSSLGPVLERVARLRIRPGHRISVYDLVYGQGFSPDAAIKRVEAREAATTETTP